MNLLTGLLLLIDKESFPFSESLVLFLLSKETYVSWLVFGVFYVQSWLVST
jgi:hypothetical protein